jgi:nucleoside-diphosphate-sugar epimerase
MKNLLILGCGWVGEELAYQLKGKGWNVWVTTTTPEKYHRLKNDGIFAYIHDFDRDFDVGQEAAQGVSSTSTLVNPLENYKRLKS